MQLYEALELQPSEVISFCGGGGKTSTIQRLCAELRSINRTVISTVTTRIGADQTDGIEPVLIGNAVDLSSIQKTQIRDCISRHGWALIAGQAAATKLSGIDPNAVASLRLLADYVLIEADGARSLPIKAPAEYEPVIAVTTTLTVVVIGIDAMGRQILPGQVHRPEEICRVTDAKPGDTVNSQIVATLIVHTEGLFKGTPETARRVVIVNKIATTDDIAQAHRLVAAVRALDCNIPLIMADTRAPVPVISKHIDDKAVRSI